MISSSPRSLRAFTTLAPMNPAAPVTTIMCVLLWRTSREKLVGMDDGSAELADHDACRFVRPAYRVREFEAGRQHDAERRDHSVPGPAHIVDFLGDRRYVQGVTFPE